MSILSTKDNMSEKTPNQAVHRIAEGRASLAFVKR